VVNVFSPVTAFISVNGVTALADANPEILTADIRDSEAAAFYRYFSPFSGYFTWF
jgi:hypothetical protein